jgi:hypothetical protein
LKTNDLEQRHQAFMVQKMKLEGSSWWFENIHPEDSIKMSVKLYSFLEQKQKNGKMNTALDVLTILINTFLTEALS